MADGGRLYVCATPIGNLGDVSDRLREVLQTADVVYAEDTRRTATLLRHVGASPSMRSLFVGNEKSRTADLLASLDQGLTVAMVTDAGMPTVSDPGSDVIRLARQAGHLVTVVPGPSAVVAAVALAGFGGDRFVFEGFLPRKGKERSERLRPDRWRGSARDPVCQPSSTRGGPGVHRCGYRPRTGDRDHAGDDQAPRGGLVRLGRAGHRGVVGPRREG